MGNQFAEVFILAEDKQQQTFVYRYLMRKGVNPRRIRKLPLAAGKGSGEQFVRREFGGQLRALRRKPHVRTGLIAILDADTGECDRRIAQLNEGLTLLEEPAIDAKESVAVLVPKRNIETWIHHLMGVTVDEETAYPKLHGDERACEPAVRELCSRDPYVFKASAPPSLVRGYQELQRFLAAVSNTP